MERGNRNRLAEMAHFLARAPAPVENWSDQDRTQMCVAEVTESQAAGPCTGHHTSFAAHPLVRVPASEPLLPNYLLQKTKK